MREAQSWILVKGIKVQPGKCFFFPPRLLHGTNKLVFPYNFMRYWRSQQASQPACCAYFESFVSVKVCMYPPNPKYS
jgi:hypothetical protein